MGDASPRASIRGILLRTLALVAVVPFLPLALLIFLGYRDDVGRVEREILTTNRQIAILAAHTMHGFLRATAAEATQAAREAGSRLPPASDDARWERVDSDGTVLASQVDEARIGRPCGYEAALADPRSALAVIQTAVGDWIPEIPPTVLIAARSADPAGGAVVGVLSPEGLHGELTASLGEAVDSRVYVVDQQGRPLFYSDLQLAPSDSLARNPPMRMFQEGGSGPIRYRSTITGKERLGFVQPLPGGRLAAVVSADLGSAVIGLRDRYLIVAWSVPLALVAVAGLGAGRAAGCCARCCGSGTPCGAAAAATADPCRPVAERARWSTPISCGRSTISRRGWRPPRRGCSRRRRTRSSASSPRASPTSSARPST